MLEAKRFNQVDQKSFAGERTGFGFLIESERFGDWAFETGLLKASRQYTVLDGDKVVAEEVDRLHLPISAKFYFFNNVAAGLGGYGSYAVSKKERAVEDNASSGESTSAHYDEYGIVYLLSAHYLIKSTDFILDLRYFEPSASKNGERTNNLMLSLGLRFEI